MEELERQNVVERERARIAQDIHDDIGTSLIRIAMFSQPERNEIDHPQQTAAVLSRIYSTAREMTRVGAEVEVLEPATLREKMTEIARTLAAYYGV